MSSHVKRIEPSVIEEVARYSETPETKNYNYKDVLRLEDCLCSAIDIVREILDSGYIKNIRELSVTRTKLEEAKMWFDRCYFDD